MNVFIYAIIILAATISGSVTGLGGGVIIKPLFDIIGYHDASTISFYSSTAVFTMCVVSIYNQTKKGFEFDLKTIIAISMGSILGGFLGENIFNAVTVFLMNNQVKIIQSFLLGLMLIIILLYALNKDKVIHYKLTNIFVIFGAGVLLGTISIFLGIGGGPLNVAIMMILFSYSMKDAAIYSIATIFFSQVSKLTVLTLNKKIFEFDLSFVPIICIAAIVGGIIGTLINQKLDNKSVEKFYNILMVVLLFISSYNIISNI